MANFYPVNTPLINYFFYKAPFVQNGFSLTEYEIQDGGTGYAVNDIIIFTGGTFTTPFCAKVGTVTAGVVTSLLITNAGVYSTTPTTLTQAFTDGSGTGLILENLVFDSNFLQPPGPNIPLTGGYLFFYEDENRTVKANTYSDVSDPSNPTVNPNPIQLGTSGDTPLFYMDDRFYYIVITDNTGDQSNPVEVIEHYNPSEVISNTSAFNDNFIVNPQFNYPIEFYTTNDEIGEITKPITNVAWAWEFIEDDATLSENLVTFESIAGQGIEGDPAFQIVLSSNDVSSTETLKDFRCIIGAVDFYNDQQLTFSAQMMSQLGSSVNVILYLEKYYGVGGSEREITELESFSVSITRNKYTFAFDVPSNAGKTVGENSYLALRIQPGIRTICKFAMTNLMALPGSQLSPVFVDEPSGFSKAQIVGQQIDFNNSGLYQNYSSYYYTDGDIFPYADAGTAFICPLDSDQPFRALCDGASLKVNDYSPNDIPYRRLYDVIGTRYGSGGELIVYSNQNVVTFTTGAGARAFSAYTAGTSGVTVANPNLGLRNGFNLTNNHDMTVSGIYADDFAPDQTLPLTSYLSYFSPSTNPSVINYWGSAPGQVISPVNLSIATTVAGGPGTPAEFLMTFGSNNPYDYKTRVVYDGGSYVVASFMEFATLANNTRVPAGITSVNQCVIFFLDGDANDRPGVFNVFSISASDFIYSVNLSSRLSMLENIPILIKALCDPFIWTVTVNTVPAASSYFLYSSSTADFYAWFKVDGVGTDPAIPGRTGVEVDISSIFTNVQIATIIADTLNTEAFNLPDQTDFPVIPSPTKATWFINL